jgi:hypothetical protein
MTDLRDRFALADQLDAPAIWDRVEAKSRGLGPGRDGSEGRRAGPTRIVAALVASVVFLAAGAFLWRSFMRDRRPETEPSPPSVDIEGVPFGVCDPMSIRGDFGDGLDTAWLFQRASASEGCFSRAVYYLGLGTPDIVSRLSERLADRDLSDADFLWPFAAADLNGDGIDEIAIGVGSSRETPARFALFRLMDSNVARITWCQGCGALADWAGPSVGVAGSYQGAFCHEHNGSPVFTTWNVERSDDRARLVGWSIDYALNGSRFEEVARRTIDLPADSMGSLPTGGGLHLCGSPVHPAHDFVPYAP